MKKITKNLTISEIFASFPEQTPEIAEELRNAGLGCVGCISAGLETLEMGMQNHGFSDEQIDKVVERLNEIVSKK